MRNRAPAARLKIGASIAASMFVIASSACLELTGVSDFKIVDCDGGPCSDASPDASDSGASTPFEGDLCTSAASCGMSFGLSCVTLTVPGSAGPITSSPGVCLPECMNTASCSKNYSCVSLSGTGGVRSCARNCDPTAPPGECGTGLGCAFASTTVTVCASGGTVTQEQSCEGDDLACANGLVCDHRNGAALCRRYCTLDGKVMCDTNDTCTVLSEWPVSFDSVAYGVCLPSQPN